MYVESGRFGFPIVIDGYFLPKTLPEIFNAGEQAKVPLLYWAGIRLKCLGWPLCKENPTSADAYQELVKQAYPEDYQEVLSLYPYSDPEEIAYSATDLASDRFIAYSTWKWFDLHRKNAEQPVYRYLYSKLRPPLKDESLASGLAGGTVPKEGRRSNSSGLGRSSCL
jgi:para-nitrobenzyl esterase